MHFSALTPRCNNDNTKMLLKVNNTKESKNIKTEQKFNSGLTLIGLAGTGPMDLSLERWLSLTQD